MSFLCLIQTKFMCLKYHAKNYLVKLHILTTCTFDLIHDEHKTMALLCRELIIRKTLPEIYTSAKSYYNSDMCVEHM